MKAFYLLPNTLYTTTETMAQQLNLLLPEPAQPWPRWTTWGIIAAVWTFPGLAALSYYYLNQTVSAQPMSWMYAFVSTLPNWYLWAAMTPAILWLAQRYRLERSNWKDHATGDPPAGDGLDDARAFAG